MNWLVVLPFVNASFALALGYLGPALNILAQKGKCTDLPP